MEAAELRADAEEVQALAGELADFLAGSPELPWPLWGRVRVAIHRAANELRRARDEVAQAGPTPLAESGG